MSAPAARAELDREDAIFLLVSGLVLGAAVGWAGPHVAAWVAELMWVPFRAPLRLVGASDAWAAWARAAFGACAGGLAAYAVGQASCAEAELTPAASPGAPASNGDPPRSAG